MKHDFMNDFYYGRFRPFERKVSLTPEHAAIEKKIDNEREYFCSKLSPEDYCRFQDLEDLFIRSNGYFSVDDFSCGLCIGALMMMEVFTFKEKRLTKTE